MNALQRRKYIMGRLEEGGAPVSATVLAGELSVSRQIIVGDVALLRAGGAHITATPRGYVLERPPEGRRFTIACRHTPEEMARELEIMVDNGCTVLDVVVEHPVYGQLTGALHVRSRSDVAQFIRRVAENRAKPLSNLTGGVHLHTIRTPDEAACRRVIQALEREGFLFHMP